MAEDKNEINLENLEQVTGGASSRPAGITCPECGGFIPVSMEQFNTIGSIICPCCGNKLNINQQESKSAIDALKKFM